MPVRRLIILCALVAAALPAGAWRLRAAGPGDWPGFRGPLASGIAAGVGLPDAWDVSAGTNIRWKVPVPGLAHSSPIVWGDRIFVTSAVSSSATATFKPGLYMPTPLAHDGILYVLGNQGLLDAYAIGTGDELYRQRLPHQGSGFSASPVMADGRLYLSSEDGDIFVVKAGRSFEILGRHSMGEPLMATPALAGDAMYVRGERHLFAVAATR